MSAGRERAARFRVVRNDEEQFSIWPSDRTNPRGWRDEGTTGTREECLAHIRAVWTDARPRSLRRAMEDAARRSTGRPPEGELPRSPERAEMDLVSRLTSGDHRMAVSRLRERSGWALRERIGWGTLHVLFTDTAGGTEIGIRLDDEKTDASRADFELGTGTIHLEGRTVLDSVPVRCVAEIDLRTLSGTGRLEREPGH